MKRTKVVYKNVSQGCNKIRRSESKKTQPHYNLIHLHVIIQPNLYQNRLINEWVIENLA